MPPTASSSSSTSNTALSYDAFTGADAPSDTPSDVKLSATTPTSASTSAAASVSAVVAVAVAVAVCRCRCRLSVLCALLVGVFAEQASQVRHDGLTIAAEDITTTNYRMLLSHRYHHLHPRRQDRAYLTLNRLYLINALSTPLIAWRS